MLLASYGGPFARDAIAEALRTSEGQPVAVIVIARIYGSAFGLPNPGLLPTGKELAEQQRKVQTAIAAIESQGQEAWGQVAASRRPARTIVKAARARGVQTIVLSVPPAPRWRRLVEGDPAREVQRRAGTGISVHPVP
ncbi:MAG: hypothetical protein J2P57_05195 [Acidimicrobiaceae bacterium]|nr:hypothetical protein [Acidimicrobiaceae bacterium]